MIYSHGHKATNALPRHEIVVIHITMVTNCTTNSLSCTIVITDILGFVLDIFIFTVKFQNRKNHEDSRNKKKKYIIISKPNRTQAPTNL